jgi:HSP20 family molecular chaperone IbpA
MSMFDDDNEDPFDEIVKQFFGEGSSRRGASKKNKIIESEEDERMIDFIEEGDNAYLVFELPGYRKEDVRVLLEGDNIEIVARRKVSESVPSYLANRFNSGVEFKKNLPKSLRKKKMNWTFNNGVLEVEFKK